MIIFCCFLWNLTRGHASVGQPARIYLCQLYVDTGCHLEDLLGVMVIGTDGKRQSGKFVLSA